MPLPDQPSDADDANAIVPATPPVDDSPTIALDTTDIGDAGVAALADNLEYTFTVGQALERIAAAGRKAPSGRSLQRYCIEGRLAATKIRTIFGSEWLINESSLTQMIEAEPIVTGDACVAMNADTAPTATPDATARTVQAVDTPEDGVASVVNQAAMASPAGERRSIAEVLIENARLLAQVEGRDAIISELKEDRIFLREEVREGRRTRDDVKNIAERMLDTLKTMAVGRSVLSAPPHEPLHTNIIDPENRHG